MPAHDVGTQKSGSMNDYPTGFMLKSFSASKVPEPADHRGDRICAKALRALSLQSRHEIVAVRSEDRAHKGHRLRPRGGRGRHDPS